MASIPLAKKIANALNGAHAQSACMDQSNGRRREAGSARGKKSRALAFAIQVERRRGVDVSRHPAARRPAGTARYPLAEISKAQGVTRRCRAGRPNAGRNGRESLRTAILPSARCGIGCIRCARKCKGRARPWSPYRKYPCGRERSALRTARKRQQSSLPPEK